MTEESRLDMPFVGISSFLRSPIHTDLVSLDAAIAVLGAPTDEGSPFKPGSRFGARAMREHSLRFVSGKNGYYDPQRGRRFLEREMNGAIVDVGDADILPTNLPGTFDNITASTRGILEAGAMPVVLGGDHAITYPVVRAFMQPLHVIHLDAHLDYMPFIHGMFHTNMHAFRHIRKMSHVQSLTQVGIRSLRDSEVMHRDSAADGNRIVTMEECRRLGGEGVLSPLPKDAPCYVSIDIDILDLSLVPGCVSAEPDGMSYRELRDLLAAIATHTEVVGFDLVEVNPMLDVGTGVTAYLGAHIVLEFLGQICAQPRWTRRFDEWAKHRAIDLSPPALAGEDRVGARERNG
jgi:agmatinase